jgi:ribulose 1,5-bisphosphate synthetase/thiazole synthase
LIRTVDLVITGAGSAALTAAADALRRGRRILVLLRSGDSRVGQRFRRCLCKAANVNDIQVTVMTNAQVVCVDGVNDVEAVVIRHARTGRLCAVNASAFLSCDASTKSARVGR